MLAIMLFTITSKNNFEFESVYLIIQLQFIILHKGYPTDSANYSHSVRANTSMVKENDFYPNGAQEEGPMSCVC